MRVLALLLLLILVPALIFGIVYVPRHDGAWLDLILTVFVPTAGIGWCLWQLVRQPRGSRRTDPQAPDRKSRKAASRTN